MKIQIDLNKELHKKIMLDKVIRDKNTLAETVVILLQEHYDKDISNSR